MEVLTTEKPTSWAERIRGMKIDSVLHADFDCKNTIRASIRHISGVSKRKFTTKKIILEDEKKTVVLEVKRTK